MLGFIFTLGILLSQVSKATTFKKFSICQTTDEDTRHTLETLSQEARVDGCVETMSWLQRQTSLDLTRKNITNLSPLTYAANLKWLFLSKNFIIDLSPLNNLRLLRLLDISHNPIGSIAHLSNLNSLVVLNISNTSITNLQSLHYLPKLKILSSKNNQIRNFEYQDLRSKRGRLHINKGHTLTPKQYASHPFKNKCNRPGLFALTFDDGPSKHLDTILPMLRTHNVPATFFVVGERLNRRSLVRRMQQTQREGHEIANHTWSHPNLRKLSPSEIRSELENTNEAIFSALGIKPTITRPPYGATNSVVNSVVRSLGYTIVLWNLDSMDYYRFADSETYYYLFYKSVTKADPKKDSFISLQHDLHMRSIGMLPRAIAMIKEKGFKFVTLSECLREKT